MAKFAIFALALAAMVAFSEVSAYRTTITTTIIQDNGAAPPILDSLPVPPEEHQTTGTIPENYMVIPGPSTIDSLPVAVRKQCRIQLQQLNHCQMHLSEGRMNPSQQHHLQLCCNQLKQVREQCQCAAIQEVFDESRQQVGVIKMRQMLNKAQNLPNDCKLEVNECPLAAPRV